MSLLQVGQCSLHCHGTAVRIPATFGDLISLKTQKLLHAKGSCLGDLCVCIVVCIYYISKLWAFCTNKMNWMKWIEWIIFWFSLMLVYYCAMLLGNVHFQPDQFAVLKWYEFVCVCNLIYWHFDFFIISLDRVIMYHTLVSALVHKVHSTRTRSFTHVTKFDGSSHGSTNSHLFTHCS